MSGMRKIVCLVVLLVLAVHNARSQAVVISDALDLPKLGQDGHNILRKASDTVSTAYTSALDNWHKISTKFGPTSDTIKYFIQKRSASKYEGGDES